MPVLAAMEVSREVQSEVTGSLRVFWQLGVLSTCSLSKCASAKVFPIADPVSGNDVLWQSSLQIRLRHVLSWPPLRHDVRSKK